MTKDDLYSMAHDCDIDWHEFWNEDDSNKLEEFSKMIRFHERQKMAQMMDEEGWTYGAALIRTKGNK